MPDLIHKLYTAKQVREQDDNAIHSLGIAGYELMDRAGRAVISVVTERHPHAGHWLVVCGSGNNGGDGYVVARLAHEAGVAVSVYSVVDTASLSGDAVTAYEDWLSTGGKVLPWPPADDEGFDLALDAMLGTGIDRATGGNFLTAIQFLNGLACPVVAIDIPSGLNADTGCAMGAVTQADTTITFVGKKRGMYTADGPDFCGEIYFNDLEIPADYALAMSGAGRLVTMDYLQTHLSARKSNSHKGSYGHVLCVGGIAGMSGAIRLCGEASLRSGAGTVTLATDPEHAALINVSRPEMMVRPVSDAIEIKAALDNVRIVAVGPGLGRSEWSEMLLNMSLAASAALVVDADGLNLLAARDNTHNRDEWILTPHPAEAARLLGCDISAIQTDRIAAAQAIAGEYNAVVVLKGCGTVIADADGQWDICPLGNPGMSTAGSGDVLTGIIAALLAQGLACREAAIAGVVAHASAGDLAARNIGQIALLAGDIIECLPAIWLAHEGRL